MKRCHYDILGVERKATPNEIKIVIIDFNKGIS
jgi:hypothetical protein